ncbi:hypothetical protein EBR43_05290 [bacterium]|nr:hypothetical protein [bacterium]
MADVNQLITDFYRVAATREFARDFNFRVLSINTGGASTVTFDENDLVYVKTASLPERAITNIPVPYMGLNFNIPGNATYPGSEAYTLTFYADAKSQLRQKFEQWSTDIFDDSNSTGNYFSPKQTAIIDLVQLDNQLNKVAQYQLVGVSIRSVGPLQYNIASGTGETIEFTVTISYHYWRKIS